MADPIALFQAVLIIGVFSLLLWKENPYYRVCEHAFLGTALGYSLVVTVKAISTTAIFPLVNARDLTYIVPIALGIILYARVSKNTVWISRWPIAVVVGVGMALGIRGVVYAYIISQVKTSAAMSFLTANMLNNFNNLVMFLTTVLVMLFFTFTVLRGEKEGSPMYNVRRVARMLIMVTLGAYYGSTVMGRLTLLAGQIRQLLIAFALLPA